MATVTLNPAVDETLAVARFRPGAVNRVTRVEAHPGGAGDAMVAGFVVSLLAGLSLPELARQAIAFSLAALARLDRRLPGRAELKALARRVAVRSLPLLSRHVACALESPGKL